MKDLQSFSNWLAARLRLKDFKLIDLSCLSNHNILWFCVFLLLFFCLKSSNAQGEQKTHSIYMVKTVEIGEDIYEIDNKRILTQTHTVRKGEYLSKILREKGLWKKDNLSELLSILKKLNRSLRNLDLIYPGDKIIVPVKITPFKVDSEPDRPPREVKAPVAARKGLDFENYTIKSNDTLFRVAKRRYNIPPEDFYNEYIELVKKSNPYVKDINALYPGQHIRLPIYTPEIIKRPVRQAIPPKPNDTGEHEIAAQKANPIAHDLGKIFFEIGEELVQSGDHFMPFKSGGMINLNTSSFPIINLQNGKTVIVDLSNRLPKKVAGLIESSWENYKVVHFSKQDDLKSALDKILRVCNYPKVFKRGEAFELKGDIAFRITGDWIVSLTKTKLDNRPGVIVINLTDLHTPGTPRLIRDYLESLSVKIIDYPGGDDDSPGDIDAVETLEGGTDSSSLIKTVLNLTGRPFSSHVEIPVYQSLKADFKLIIKADFFMKIKGRDAIIDIGGLAPEIISFLKEHQFLVLPLATVREPLDMVAKTLDFLDIKFASGLHSFMAAKRDASRNVKLTLPGIIFSDLRGEAILATLLNLPGEIAAFLLQKGYKILELQGLHPSKAAIKSETLNPKKKTSLSILVFRASHT